MSLIFLATGHTHLGVNKRDKDGNITEIVPARFEFAPDGPCVAVGELDPETMAPKDNPSIYGDWDPAGYLKEALDMLKPRRPGNIPDFKAIIQKAYTEDGNDLVCDYCSCYNCLDCIVRDWKEEAEE